MYTACREQLYHHEEGAHVNVDMLDQPNLGTQTMAEYLLPSHPDCMVEDRFTICEEYADSLEVPQWALIRTLLHRPVEDEAALVDVISSIQYDLEFHTLCSVLHLPTFNLQEFFSRIFPSMIKAALRMPELFPTGTLGLLVPGSECSVSLTREQIACLLVHMFLCTLRPPSWSKNWANFGIWYNSTSVPVLAYLQCLLTYFSQLDASGRPPNPHQQVQFKRCVLSTSPDWRNSKSHFRADMLTPSHSLHPVPGCNVEVSFANKDVGFGVSGTQEEVKMGMSPEACVVVLLAPTLHDNETLLTRGARQVGRCEGIGREVKYAGPCEEERDWTLRCILAMDAMELDVMDDDCDPVHELKEEVLLRELNKAYCGFTSVPSIVGGESDSRVAIATGHWGCGAFGGNKYVKSLIQVMAACETNKRLVFHDITTKSHDQQSSQGTFMQQLCDFLLLLSQENVTVSKLCLAILKVKGTQYDGNVFDEVRSYL